MVRNDKKLRQETILQLYEQRASCKHEEETRRNSPIRQALFIRRLRLHSKIRFEIGKYT